MASGNDPILNGLEQQEEHSFNWRLFLTIGWLSRWWIIIYFLLAILFAYLYDRYATPVYESHADVQFKDRSKENAIDLGILVSKPNIDRLNEEMTILKSKGYKIEALKDLQLQVSYYIKERVKSAEVYTQSPARFDVQVIDSSIIGVHINFEILNNTTYAISYYYNGAERKHNFEFNKSYNTPAFNITGRLLNETAISTKSDYYFTINNIIDASAEIENQINIDVENMYGGKIVVNYRNPNKYKSRDVVNAVANEIVDESIRRKAKSAEMIILFIQDQIDSLEKQLYDQENILKDFKKNNQLINPDLAESNIVTKLSEIDKEQFDVMLEEKSLKWLEEFTANKNNDIEAITNYFGDLKFNDFSPYINSLLELKKQRDDLGISVSSSDPRLTSILNQMEEIKSNFKNAIVNAQAKLDVRKSYLNSEEQKYESEFLSLPEKQSEFARLTRLNDLKEKYYLLLLEKQSEYEITLAGMTSDYEILDSAQAGGLVAPVKAKIWGICLLVGLGLSFAHVYFKFLLHNIIIGVPDVEKATTVPMLGILPKYTKVKSDLPEVVVTRNPKSHIAEAFRAIRSNMQFFLRNNLDHHLIAITSTVSGEGKTFTALNLASVISATGKKVLIIDFDLRKPKVHKAFGLKNDKGVRTVLIKKHTMQECIQHMPEYGPDILIAGPVPPNPAELLISQASDDLLNYAKEHYDIVLIDSPPVGVVSDSLPLMSKVDLSIYIVRANYSKRNFIGNINRLYHDNQLKNLTIIVNDADASGTAYGYGYGYGYGYSGYNDYYDDSIPQQPFWKRFFGINTKIW